MTRSREMWQPRSMASISRRIRSKGLDPMVIYPLSACLGFFGVLLMSLLTG